MPSHLSIAGAHLIVVGVVQTGSWIKLQVVVGIFGFLFLIIFLVMFVKIFALMFSVTQVNDLGLKQECGQNPVTPESVNDSPNLGPFIIELNGLE